MGRRKGSGVVMSSEYGRCYRRDCRVVPGMRCGEADKMSQPRRWDVSHMNRDRTGDCYGRRGYRRAGHPC